MPSFLSSRLGLTCPILQAPMAGVSTPALAAAVSNAGALGALGLGASTPEQAREQIRATQALASRPFNVNLFCHAPARADTRREQEWLAWLAPLFAEQGATAPPSLQEIYVPFQRNDALLEVLLETRPAVVSFHFGLPRPDQLAALRQAGTVLLATATCLQEARAIEAAGLDAVVAQGVQAGGHRGCFQPDDDPHPLDTCTLVEQLAAAVDLPVIAAGGLLDGQDLHSMLQRGAIACQLGTAFIPCPESAASDAYRRALLAPERVTCMTRTLSGRPARGLINRLIEHGSRPEAPPVPDYPIAYDAAKQLHAAAMKQGCHDFAAHWAGAGEGTLRAMPAAELVRVLEEERQQAAKTD